MDNKEQNFPVSSVTRSYVRSIQHEHYGGKRYEKSEFFSSHSFTWSYLPTPEELNEASRSLFGMAKLDVENAISQEISSIRVENSPNHEDQADLSDSLEIQGDDDDKKVAEELPF